MTDGWQSLAVPGRSPSAMTVVRPRGDDTLVIDDVRNSSFINLEVNLALGRDFSMKSIFKYSNVSSSGWSSSQGDGSHPVVQHSRADTRYYIYNLFLHK